MQFIHSHYIVCSSGNYGNYGAFGIKDVLIEVLCCLPPNILMQCSCVCKRWYVLIHRYCVPRITPSLPFLGCVVRIKASSTDTVIDRAVIPGEYDFDAFPPVFNLPVGDSGDVSLSAEHFLDSQDGLMLYRHPSEKEFVLWNQFSEALFLVNWPGQKPESFAVLAVDIRNWKPGRRMDMFKIISFPENNGILNVFSSYNWTWVERKVICVDCCGRRPIGCDTYTLDKSFVYLKGELFSLCYSDTLLLRFSIGDGDEDVFNFCSLPNSGANVGCLGSCGERIQYVENNKASRSMQIWEIDLDAHTWTQIYSFRLNVMRKHPELIGFRAVRGKFKPLALDPVYGDGVIIWTPNLIFCYYYKSNHLIPMHCSDVLVDALTKHPPPDDAFVVTRCLAVL
ncbi:hypothetical protein V6N13_047877 [Hibiscus sabdariffa]|uniref:F-box domain-containing protein n=1 Tax=Hibiscus sabdariffa TaxID=183260 RepID=A0ABR2F5H6_9ROSI